MCTRDPELVRKMSSAESTNSENNKMTDVVCKNVILLQLSRCKYVRLCMILSVQIHHVISPTVSNSPQSALENRHLNSIAAMFLEQ